LDVVRIECERCGRAGSYRRDGLVARFGADIALPDLLLALAHASVHGTSLAHAARGVPHGEDGGFGGSMGLS